MSATEDETTARQPTASSKWSRRRKASVVTAIVACAAVAGSFLPTAVGGWAPVLHWTCFNENVASRVAWIPAVLVNAPYGGIGWGNATILPGFILHGSGFGSSDGTGAGNGSAAGVFFHVEMNLSKLSNQAVWGPGSNVRCQEEGYSIRSSVYFNGSQVYSDIFMGPGNRSDALEPHMLNFTPAPSDSTVYFTNGFSAASMASVSTCNTAAMWEPVRVSGVTVEASFDAGNRSLNVSYTIPFPFVFEYYFPPDFGTWQVDNLSAPGGPGGGWAFSYSPCP